jgi:endonuclease III
MTAPREDEIRTVQRRLRASQGPFVPKPGLPILDELIATVLSQHTSDVNSERAFAQLKERFPAWEQVADAPQEEVAEAIRAGGIANQKARRIHQILAAIEDREGSLDVSRLHDCDDEAVEEYLRTLPGVGPKTAACVLVFSMGRPAFPIDTHVHRIVLRLGWMPPNATADQAYRLLAPLVPPDIRYDLHVAMITHGRTVCRARQPSCGGCVLRDLCPYPDGAEAGSISR